MISNDNPHKLPFLSYYGFVSYTMCHEALSQIISNACFPSATSLSQHHAKYWGVMLLTGRPSTKRSHTCSVSAAASATVHRTSSP